MNSSSTARMIPSGILARPAIVDGASSATHCLSRPSISFNVRPIRRSRRSCCAPLHAGPAPPTLGSYHSGRVRDSGSVQRSSRGVSQVCAASRGRDGKERTSEMPDYWAMLEVERGAGSEAVKDSYRRLQKVYHPDKAQVSPKSPPHSYSRYNLAGFETTGPDVANVLFCPLSGSIFQAGP